ncbi:hypothetical protein [Halopolyspora algeriensis]|nr:hypothetical protein [Halopolyspora algeriensis]
MDDNPFYRITPVGMGAIHWLAIEQELDVSNVRALGEITSVLDAAAPQSASLFALLRLGLPAGGHVDASSGQIELRGERCCESLPIDLHDLPQGALGKATSAKLILLFEARDVDIDFYGLEVRGIVRSNQAIT